MAKPEVQAGSPHKALGLQHTMPLLLINLGGEMLYVLEQRLGAQSARRPRGLR